MRTYLVVCPRHPDLTSVSERLAVELVNSPLGIFLHRVRDISDALGLAGRLVRGDEAMSDGSDEREMGEEIGGRRSVRQGRDEEGRTEIVSSDQAVSVIVGLT